MDYLNFLDEYDSYNEWNLMNKKEPTVLGGSGEDHITFPAYPEFKSNARAIPDMVNNPKHYTRGRKEVIDIIEDAIEDAPSAIYGMLQGQVLKYVLRMWNKDNPEQDAQKAIWYLERLIKKIKELPSS